MSELEDRGPEARRADGRSGEIALVRHEEELAVERVPQVAGALHVRKVVESERVEDVIARQVEHTQVERHPANEDDSGEVETLPDGAVSIPVLAEELVVTRRVVVRERLVVRKVAVTEEQPVVAELQRERIDLVADPAVQGLVEQVTAPPAA